VKAGNGLSEKQSEVDVMKRILILLFVFVVFPVVAPAQVKNTENTLKLAEGQVSEKATIADIEWLAGNWIGTGLGGVSEEIWSKPQGGIMMGNYRLIKEGKPVFYEMCWLLENEGSLILRLKHFNADLTGWEEKDKTVDFKFVKKDGRRIYFTGLTFENASGNEMNIFLALRSKDGSQREEVFKMKRVS
jgi:hypothetical protein